MPLSNRLAAYADCIKLYETAIADAAGARCKFQSRVEAHYFVQRMHRARSLLRGESMIIYSGTDPRSGKTEFDCLVVRIKFMEDTHWVYAERPNTDLEIEPLTRTQPYD